MANKYQYFYLIEIQYLGFRYHGWQIQGKLKTIQLMLGKTISYIWPHTWKILAAGRTDALVSARSGYFELFTLEPIDEHNFMLEMNINLPPDIALLSIKEVNAGFNIINDVVEKTYQYYFAYGQQKYPLSASLISFFGGDLNISEMITAAEIFEGTHDFSWFSKDIKEGSKRTRSIKSSRIGVNEELLANFFPPESFVFEVKGKGFARHQIRLMMGALVQVGRGELKVSTIEKALNGEETMLSKLLAPASGLMVKEIKYASEDQ